VSFVLQTILDSLNPDQQKAAQHTTGPAMVLAGAGSGKTRVLTTRVAWLLDQNPLQPSSILLVTFTNKAAGEMKERIHQLTGQALPFAGTFHSISARILRKHAQQLGYENHFSIYDSDDQMSLLKELYKKHGIDPKQYNLNAVKAKISEAKNELISSSDLSAIAQNGFQETVALMFDSYNKALRKNQAMDFDDLLIKVVELLKTKPHILEFFQNQFQYILIDEYQDTNTVQYELTRLLSAPQENVFVVGDFAQSIYAWRGADYRNMMRLKDDFIDIAEYRLEQNYRSTQTILDAATHIISKTDEHPVLALWTDKIEDHPITLIEATTNEAEATQVINTIQMELNPEYTYDDIAILYRTNAQSRSIEEACLKARIPYQIIGGFKFYERKEIKDILSYVRYFANPADLVSYNRAMKLGKRRFASFDAWRNKMVADEKFNQSPHEILKSIIEVSDYEKRFNAREEDDLARLENIQELLQVASQFDNLTTFLENIALIQDNQMIDVQNSSDGKQTEQKMPTLTLMSLHAAKGLEFPVVFMVGLEEGLLPHSRSLLDKSQLEEERRLCYVGITRAQDKLFLSYAQQRWQYGSSTYTTMSRFIHDIPTKLINVTGDGSGRSSRNSKTNASSSPYLSGGTSSGRRLIIDDDTLDGVLSGEFDIDAFLDQ
jgi:DNA helicase II / ATP-dependent DNA helicase PcrA